MTEQVEAPEAIEPESTGTDALLTTKPKAEEEVKEIPAEPSKELVEEGGSVMAEPNKEDPAKQEIKESSETKEEGKQGETKFELKLPDNSTLDPAHVGKIEAFAKAQGLSGEQAQALLNRESDSYGLFVEEAEQTMKQTTTQWLEEFKADPEIGGDNANRSAELAKRVVKRYGSEKFASDLNASGFGNHPELIRFAVNVGNAMSEDQLVLGGAKSPTKKTIEETFYGKNERAS